MNRFGAGRLARPNGGADEGGRKRTDRSETRPEPGVIPQGHAIPGELWMGSELFPAVFYCVESSEFIQGRTSIFLRIFQRESAGEDLKKIAFRLIEKCPILV